jgi:chemotaxis protein MotA
MKQTTAIGIVLAIALIMVGVIMEGGSPASFINIPAFLIVCGGTLGVCLAGQSIEKTKMIPKLMILAMKGNSIDYKSMIKNLVGYAEKARREGLLALEDDVRDSDEVFVKKGLQLVVDGADSEMIRSALDSEIAGMETRHAANENVYRVAGGFGPTIGILGTVLSLVHVLENLSDPSSLGHSIAGAFIATLYGVGSANVIYFPIANRLKEMSSEEVHYREMIVDAILAIQAGENPRLLAERLQSYLPPAERDENAGSPAGSQGDSRPADEELEEAA